MCSDEIFISGFLNLLITDSKSDPPPARASSDKFHVDGDDSKFGKKLLSDFRPNYKSGTRNTEETEELN